MYDFDSIIERQETESIKWDYCEDFLGYKNLFPMWVADMDFPVATEIYEAIQKRATHPIYGYTRQSETSDAAFIHWCKQRYHWNVRQQSVLFSPGIVPAISLAILAYTEAQDKVLIQTPVYHPFFESIRKTGRQVLENPLKEDNGRYSIDFDLLDTQMKQVKLFILCNPHNPVSKVFTDDELKTIADLAEKHKVIVFSDEIHADIVFKPNKHRPFADISEATAERCLVALAPSKTFNIAGLSASAIVIPNNTLRKEFLHIQQGMHAFMPNVFGTVAFEAAYTSGEAWLDELLKYLEDNIHLMESFFATELPEIRISPIEGTFLAWLDFRQLFKTHAQTKEFVYKNAGLGLNSGVTFGKNGAGFMRLNFGTPKKNLQYGLDLLKAAYHSI